MKRSRHFGVGLALGALLTAGALASSAFGQTVGERTPTELGQAVGESGEQGSLVLYRDPSQAETFVADVGPSTITSAPSDAFDWGDAVIGAGSALGLAALVAAGFGGLVLINRRRRAIRGGAHTAPS
jgi:hypothetical protein